MISANEQDDETTVTSESGTLIGRLRRFGETVLNAIGYGDTIPNDPRQKAYLIAASIGSSPGLAGFQQMAVTEAMAAHSEIRLRQVQE